MIGSKQGSSVTFRSLLLVLTLLALAAPGVPAQTFYMPGAEPHVAPSDTTLTIEVHSLAAGVYAAKVRYVWTGWVELPEGILLIDTSFDDVTAAALADTIRARSGPKPVKYVVNTHAHGDHIGGNRYFAERGASIIAQAKVAARIDSVTAVEVQKEKGEAAAAGGASAKPIKHAQKVERKKVLGPANRRVEILWLGKPGHTAADLIVYLPKQKVLFAGDLVSNKSVPWMLDPAMDRKGWLAAVDSISSKAFPVEKLVPGHGVLADPVNELRYIRNYLNDSYDKALKTASWGTSVVDVKDWGYLGPYEDSEFYAEVHYMNMRRLYNEIKGIKTPGRPQTRAYKK